MREHGQLQRSDTADSASLHQAASNSRTTCRTPQHAAFCRPGAAAAWNFRSMCVGEDFCELVKDGSEDAKLLKRVFSYFAKKLKMEKLDDKLLKAKVD
jgi:hypothetical protein